MKERTKEYEEAIRLFGWLSKGDQQVYAHILSVAPAEVHHQLALKQGLGLQLTHTGDASPAMASQPPGCLSGGVVL
jgi:hypothetical protein